MISVVHTSSTNTILLLRKYRSSLRTNATYYVFEGNFIKTQIVHKLNLVKLDDFNNLIKKFNPVKKSGEKTRLHKV